MKNQSLQLKLVSRKDPKKSKILNIIFVISAQLVIRLQFCYKGRLATLKSASDIAAWIEERKKRFPTKARADEAAKQKQKMMEEARAAKSLRKEDVKKRREEAERKRKDLDEEAKVKLKAEKLRKQYEKAQKRVAEMEAKKHGRGEITTIKEETPSSPQPRLTSPQMTRDHHSQSMEEDKVAGGNKSAQDQNDEVGRLENNSLLEISATATSNKDTIENDIAITETTKIPRDKHSETLVVAADPLTPTSQPVSPDIPISSTLQSLTASPPSQPLDARLSNPPSIELNASSSDSDSSSEISTSSDASDTDSPSDSDSPPTEIPSNHLPPSSTPPPKAVAKKNKAICKRFLASGRCPMGDKCRYRHELPERGARKRDAPSKGREEGKKERVSLYQRVGLLFASEEDNVTSLMVCTDGQAGAGSRRWISLAAYCVFGGERGVGRRE